MEDEKMKKMEETIRHLAMGIFPGGCKFYDEKGELSPGGELVAAALADKSRIEKRAISPCEGCSYYQECEREERFKSREDRLNTDNLEFRPLTKEEMKQILQVMMLPVDDTTDWAFDPDNELDPDVKDEKLEIPWIIRMIRKRIVGENLKIEITKKAYFLLMIITGGNPGNAMFVLHKIGNLFERREVQRWLVTSQVVTSSLFPFGVPTETAFNQWWDGQKVPRGSGKSWSDNLVDVFPNEWRQGTRVSQSTP